MLRYIFACTLALLLAGCSGGAGGRPDAQLAVQPTPSYESLPNPPTSTDGLPKATESKAPAVPASTEAGANPLPTTQAPTVDPVIPSPTSPPATLAPGEWQSLPVIPTPGVRVAEIFARGQELGNNPHAFSKVGDCGSTPAWFLGDFDRGPKFYSLGEYTDLSGVIAQFQGSFGRTSLAARAGFNASSVFSPLWADRKLCNPKETPLACEYRLNKPSFALVTLGANDVWHPDSFEPQMRRIIEFSIENGVVPILSTKPDNVEKDGSLNATVAALAQEYGLPLWNYWAAVQYLPDGGLQEDGTHITWAPNRFDDAQAMKKGWPVRNLTALQVLDATWRAATGTP